MQTKRTALHNLLLKIWYGETRLWYLLLPLTGLYCFVVTIRRLFYRLNILKSTGFDVPVVVVGNITVGGTGKTPLVIWLANYFRESGYRPGIVSRGYLGKARSWPQQVRPDSDPVMVGDEAIVLASRTQCPVAVGPDRSASVAALLKYHDCDLVISDDGLQHYSLQRDVEILVIDGERRFGNGHCLPAGPLREPVQRMDKVDFVVSNGMAQNGEYAMRYVAEHIYQLCNPSSTMPLASLKSGTIHALAAIGNPQRYFSYLTRQGINIIPHAFPDHHVFVAHDVEFPDEHIILMTEKDAVKCKRVISDKMWVLPINVDIRQEFGLRLLEITANCKK